MADDSLIKESIKALLQSRIVPLESALDRLSAAGGLQFFRADKDGDGDFDPLTHASWEGATPAATGTINLNSVFGITKRVRAVLLYVSGTISFKAKSTATNGAATTGEQRMVPVASDYTIYFYGALGAVTVRVVGWYS